MDFHFLNNFSEPSVTKTIFRHAVADFYGNVPLGMKAVIQAAIKTNPVQKQCHSAWGTFNKFQYFIAIKARVIS